MSATDDFNAGRRFYYEHEVFSRLIIGAVIVLILLGAFAWQRRNYERLVEQYHVVALKAANDSALLDTTKKVLFSSRDSARFLGDSLTAVTRLVVQAKGERDALDVTLRQARTSNTQLSAQVKSLGVTKASTADVKTDTSTGVRSASFVVDSTPYHVHADVALPRVGAGTIALGVRLDPARITVRTGCAEQANADGIRAARVSLLAPPWLTLDVASSLQDDQVCNRVEKKSRGWFGAPDLLVGAGYTLNAKGAGFGVFVGGGLRIGP